MVTRQQVPWRLMLVVVGFVLALVQTGRAESATGSSQTTALIPRSVLFGNPDHSSPQISPDGSWLAYLAPVDGVMNVWVAPTQDLSKARPVTQDRKRAILADDGCQLAHGIVVAADGAHEFRQQRGPARQVLRLQLQLLEHGRRAAQQLQLSGIGGRFGDVVQASIERERHEAAHRDVGGNGLAGVAGMRVRGPRPPVARPAGPDHACAPARGQRIDPRSEPASSCRNHTQGISAAPERTEGH